MPLGLLLFGLTSYFGLRTAGNFSMYSNLRTEAGRSNHLVLGDNQLKWASYQDDVVRIVDIGNGAKIRRYLNRWGKLEGNLLPLVEFRKLLLKWRKERKVIPDDGGIQGRPDGDGRHHAAPGLASGRLGLGDAPHGFPRYTE